MCTATLDNYIFWSLTHAEHAWREHISEKKRIALLKDNTDSVIGNEMQYDAGRSRQNLAWTNSTDKL